MKIKKLDFAGIAARAADSVEAVCKHWLPNGKRAGHEWETGDRHGNPGQSLKVHLSGTKAGQWADFAAGDTGGDLVALVAYIEGIKQSEAAQRLADFLGIDTGQDRQGQSPGKPANGRQQGAAAATPSDTPKAAEWRALMPVPADAPEPPKAHIRHGTPDVVYTYLDAAGALLGYVTRWEANEKRQKKEFGWLIYAEREGRKEWRWSGFPAPRPLYGLDLLAADPSAPIVMVEGEKAADAARQLLPVHAVLTWPGGGKAADKADFRPLKGREVLLWPDADTPGHAAMQTAERLALKVGAAAVQWLNLATLAAIRNKGELPQGYDAADVLAEGWDAERLAAFMKRPDATTGPQATPPADQADTGKEASRFTVNDAGLYLTKATQNGEPRLIRLSDPLHVPALARDEEGGGWAPVLVFRDRDGQKREEILPFRQFLGDGADGVKHLADFGLAIEPGREAIDGLKQYIAGASPKGRARLVDAVGWHDNAYLFPDGAVGKAGETLVYRGNKRALGIFTPRGKLADWQKHMAALAVGNPSLMFALSVAFTGPLLKVCGGASSAFHWVGDSSLGKSGSLYAAASVWGNPAGVVHSWRSTDNAMEYTAAQHNDGLLINDELKEVDPKQAQAIAYMMGNGKGKGRARHDGGVRDAITWRLVMLSSGEIGLADHIASAGQRAHAGQSVRFIELPADAGAGLGMWNALHGLPDGAAFTNALKDAAGRYHGTPARAFIAAMIENMEGLPGTVKRLEEAFHVHHVPPEASGQVKRVASAFALVAAAGALAVEWGVCPWPEPGRPVGDSFLDAFNAAGLMFKAWLNERPTVRNLEEAQILTHVRKLMDANWQARFIDWGRVTEDNADLSRMAAVHNALGFRKRAQEWTAENQHFHFYITRGQFAEEFATKGGFKPRRVAQVLRDRGILKCDGENLTWKEQLPNGDSRSYCIRGRQLWEIEPYA